MTTSWLPTGFYDPFFSDPLLGTDFDIMDWDMGGPTDWTTAGAGAGFPQLTGRAGEGQRGPQAQGGQQPGGTRAQRRANRRTARVNLVQEDDKYLVCVEVAGRTKNDLCVALEGNMLKVCGKALEPDEEELQEQQKHFTGQAEGRTPIQGGAGEQPQPTQQQQPRQAGASQEGKEAELSGGEKLGERREVGQQTQMGRQQQQQQPTQQKQRRYLIHEFPTGRIERTIRLPADAQEEGIQAKCENGILHVCVPRLPKKRPVDIQ